MRDRLSIAYARAEAAKHRPFFVTGKSLSYAETLDRIGRITALFAELGISAGDCIAACTEDDHEMALLFLACVCNGVVFSVLEDDIKPGRARSILDRYRPKVLLIDAARASALKLEASVDAMILIEPSSRPQGLLGLVGWRRASKGTGYRARLGQLKGVRPTFAIQASDQTALVLFTSGTTANPKGVELSYANILSHTQTLGRVYALEEQSQLLNVMPLSHADGLIQGPLLTFLHGATLHRPFRFRIQQLSELAEATRARKITHFLAAPTMLALMLRYVKHKKDVFSHREFQTVISVAAQLEAQLYRAFTSEFDVKLINVYGLTETVAGSIFTAPDDTEQGGTIGRPVDCEAIIVDDDGNPVSEGAVGELLLRGPHIMKGYFRDPEATACVLKEGWLWTGDLAQQRSGVYAIVGRKKSAIIFGGFTVWPEEITEVLNRHPAVAESFTFGRQDDLWGEAAVSVVVLADGGHAGEQELREHCKRHLESYKVPRTIVFVGELPKGRSGKVQLDALKSIAEAQPRDERSVLDLVLQVASECFMVPVEDLEFGTRSEDLANWDSFGHLTFVSALEEAFAVKLKIAEVMAMDSLGDAVSIIEAKR